MGMIDGLETIRAQARLLPETPGVYRMLGADDAPLYVGKARALRRRVTSYTRWDQLPKRLQRMVSETLRMEIVHTHTEVEALLLEANLIKTLRPRYNILLKDDKSFPYIRISRTHDFPRIEKYRGEQTEDADYYGPFASSHAVNETIATLQRAFLLRNCTDAIFNARTRPCLQYHIKRCTAPCVGYVDRTAYQAQVAEIRAFLSGESRKIVERLSHAMQAASERMDYEEAAMYRDRVQALSHIQLQQDINVQGMGDADVFALARDGAQICVQVFFFRKGQNFGNKSYFPRAAADNGDAEILAAFLPQFYASRLPPREILLSHAIDEATLIEQGLRTLHRLNFGIKLHAPLRGDRRRMVDFVADNARAALERHKSERAGDALGLARVQAIFGLGEEPQRIEIYDNSHVQGTNKVGAMVVAGPEGFRKSAYRKFNIETTEAGDDFAMMREVFTRRFTRALKEGRQGDPQIWPDLVLIDGGIGQLNSCMQVLAELGIAEAFCVVAISKGPDRNAGREFFHRPGHKAFQLDPDDSGLLYMQRLRDEAHRFAIGAHRARRGRAMLASSLDEISGIGAARKKALLAHFGSGKAVERAGLKDLEAVPGISKTIAKLIYDHYQGS
ncbi:MAG: excinuclease ABC subunit UvrC [Alphaproteobacteria bacterium]|nr:excinuclease ABC subunit UvrC [Alphaproteobacteria bacterium]USO07988.1 MAG: excinuclease ABC subunit UvrC [Rhodospirillales bacterium]